MKTKNYIITVFLFVWHSSMAQFSLDTVFVTNKKSTESTEKIRYYYFPNLQTYFDTQKALYIYKQNGNWVTAKRIASNFRGYCVKNNSYVMIKGYLEDEPYSLFDQHKQKYPADYSSKRKQKLTISED